MNKVTNQFYYLKKYLLYLNNMECRFYRNKYPSVDEVVMVKVKSVEDIGIMLLYYNMVG